MLALYIVIPLMVLAVIIAVVPVLRGSIRHDRAMAAGELETGATADREADFWHRMLGHRKSRHAASAVVPTPDMVEESEIIRVGVPADDRLERPDGRTAWKSPS